MCWQETSFATSTFCVVLQEAHQIHALETGWRQPKNLGIKDKPMNTQLHTTVGAIFHIQTKGTGLMPCQYFKK